MILLEERMFKKFHEFTNSISTSLWLTPAALVIFAGVLSFLLLWLDQTYGTVIEEHIPWLFSGTPSAARSLLATIASAVITVVSIAFSLTIVAMQQASSQYSPRILRTFITNRGNQFVLGTYLATFVYALLVLRAVRESDGSTVAFVPSIAASTAILLALLCVGLLIYFINNIATSLQATTVISRVHSELIDQIENLYPNKLSESSRYETNRHTVPSKRKSSKLQVFSVESEQAGFIIEISESNFQAFQLKHVESIHITARVGDFVANGQALATLRFSKPQPDQVDNVKNEVRKAITITNQRSIDQDPLFAVRQLVDTALKGLSPGINDMTTADYCVVHLGDALGRLANREIPPAVHKLPGGAKLHLERPGWDDFIRESFHQLLRASDGKEQTLRTTLATISVLVEQIPTQQRAQPIFKLLDYFEEIINRGTYLSADKSDFQTELKNLRQKLKHIPVHTSLSF